MKNLLLVFHILLIFSIVGCADKAVYVGEKKDGKSHGQGTLTFSSGKTFVGEFKDGDFHGKGTSTYPDGRKYEGEWKFWNHHGQGTETWKDYKYVGGWKDGRKHGQGTETRKDGYKYVGGWKDGRKHGHGKWSNSDNKRWYKSYEGEFKNGKFHGQGKMTAKKIMTDDMGRDRRLAKFRGLIFKGEFKNGRPWNLKSFNDNGEQQSIIFSNGKVAGI